MMPLRFHGIPFNYCMYILVALGFLSSLSVKEHWTLALELLRELLGNRLEANALGQKVISIKFCCTESWVFLSITSNFGSFTKSKQVVWDTAAIFYYACEKVAHVIRVQAPHPAGTLEALQM